MRSPRGKDGGPAVEEFLAVENVSKSFGSVQVLRGIDLLVEQSEVLALLGPSGSGKSTLLRILAGFETANSGRLRLQGRDFTNQTAQQRGFGMVFQSYALFPHLSVADNVRFGLKHLDPAARDGRVESMLELVQLEGLGDRGIDQISGGQQQRVALARALAPEPELLLLDEPLSNLDPSLRDRTRRQLQEVLRAAGTTTILVTHEQEEAFELGDRVAVLDQGKIEQVGTPEELYRHPATVFVARFVGRSNSLPGAFEKDGESEWRFLVRGFSDSLTIPAWADLEGRVIGSGREPAADLESEGSSVEESGPATDYELWVRPEHLRLTLVDDSTATDGSQTGLPGEVVGGRLVGPYALVEVQLETPLLADQQDAESSSSASGSSACVPQFIEVAHERPLQSGQRVRVEIADPSAVRLIAVEATASHIVGT